MLCYNPTMHIAIIGGGMTGLAAAYELAKRGQHVTVFEKDAELGGLASGFIPDHGDWNWPLEKSYHHFFTNDRAIIALAKEIGLQKDCMILSPTTAVFWQNQQYPFDTPINILRFPGISFINRVRTGATAALMKLNPFWKPLEHITAHTFFKNLNGAAAWHTIWEPLMIGKFGPYAKEIAASWLWGRLYKRTPKLGYFRGGFSHFVTTLRANIEKYGGIIHTNTAIQSIKKKGSAYIINNKPFDRVLLTVPSPIASRLMRFPKDFTKRLTAIPHLWAQTLILETNTPVLDRTYWLNINDRTFPFLAVVQHTNMISKQHYGNRHIIYLGNYLPEGHPYISMTKEQLLKKFLPYIVKINPRWNTKNNIVRSFLFTVPNAQPVHQKNYSTRAPKLQTPLPQVYLANLDSIFPWDRETNYAVELGQRAAQHILHTNT